MDATYSQMNVSNYYESYPETLEFSTQNNLQECNFFYYAPNDDNFYLIKCKMIFQDLTFPDEHSYDHKFFYQCSNNPAANYYVMCKLFSHSLIANILNKQIYGMDVDTNN